MTPAAMPEPMTRDTTLRGGTDDQRSTGTRPEDVVGADHLAPGHRARDSHLAYAGGGGGDDQRANVAQSRSVVASLDPYVPLQLSAAFLSDVEALRIATEGRLRSAPLGEGSAEHARWATSLATLADLEHRAELELRRALRAHPLGGWVKDTPGVGLKQGGRLLAAIGDPAWNHADDRPRRGPAELWAYCGMHVVAGAAARRRRGERANWSAEAKMRAYLVAESCMKATGTLGRDRSPYRDVYDRARLAWEDRDTTDLHKHHHALRLAAKAMLRDLYVAAREVHR